MPSANSSRATTVAVANPRSSAARRPRRSSREWGALNDCHNHRWRKAMGTFRGGKRALVVRIRMGPLEGRGMASAFARCIASAFQQAPVVRAFSGHLFGVRDALGHHVVAEAIAGRFTSILARGLALARKLTAIVRAFSRPLLIRFNTSVQDAIAGCDAGDFVRRVATRETGFNANPMAGRPIRPNRQRLAGAPAGVPAR